MFKKQIDIQQRAYDERFIVWEYMWPYSIFGYTDKHDTFHPNLTDSQEDHDFVENDSLAKQWCKMWVPVIIVRDKAAATKYCRSRFGRNCFKENDKVAIAFT